MDHYSDALNSRKGMKISLLINGKEHAIEGHEPNSPSGLMNEGGEAEEHMDREKLGLAPATKDAGSKEEMKEDITIENQPKPAPTTDEDNSEMESQMMDGESPEKISKEFEDKKPRSLGEHLKKDLADKKSKK